MGMIDRQAVLTDLEAKRLALQSLLTDGSLPSNIRHAAVRTCIERAADQLRSAIETIFNDREM
jgi:uncharacterized protein (UPF0147 family)